MSEEPVKTRVFLSYSRKDGDFTRRLAEALEARGCEPDFDQSSRDPSNVSTGISAEDPWWPRLQAMIAAADVMVFIVSPGSAASAVCDREIAHAREIGKRIIPILWREIDFSNKRASILDLLSPWARRRVKAPPQLAALNVKIDFRDDSDEAFAAALEQLCAALDLDVAWHREHRRLTELALKWDAGARPADSLMRPADIKAAERLLERRPRSAEPPPALLGDYLDASRARIEEETRRLRRTIGRAFVKPSLQAIHDGLPEQALRLAASGALLAEDLALKLVPELGPPTARAAFENRTATVLNAHTGPVYSASFSPDGRRIATASADGTARVWDAESGAEIACLNAHTSYVYSASFSPDGRRIVTAPDDHTARVWDAESGAEIACLNAHTSYVYSASFSPDGRRIVSGSGDYTARVWDTSSGKEIACLKGHTDWVRSASFSPDGGRIVTASWDNTARVWDAESGKEIACLNAHTDHVNSASFSPDGRRIMTASDDNTARAWDVARTEAIVRERDIVITAALARGIGWRSAAERADLLMQDAPDDLYEAARERLLDPRTYPPEEIARRERLLEQTIADLNAPLHPNCYLSPTQFAEKFR